MSDKPTLILWPMADFAYTDHHRKRIEKMFPNNKSINLDGVGHYFAEDAPKETLDEVNSWLSETF